MAAKISVKRYTGVYYSESKVRKWRDRPDRSYWVAFKDSSSLKLVWERCGWASEGWTPEAAQRKRYELLDQERTGAYKPKQQRKKEKYTFDQLSVEFIEWAKVNKKSWKDDRQRLNTHIAPVLSGKPLQHISPLLIESLKKEMYKKDLSDATVKHCLALVRHMFNKAITWGLYEGANPITQVRFPKLNNRRVRFLSFEEAHNLLEELGKRSIHVRDQALLSLHAGLRFGEIAALTKADLDFSNRIIHVRNPKGGESRQAFMTDETKKMLLRRVEDLVASPTDLIFPAKGTGKRQKRVSNVFEHTANNLGLNDGIKDRRDKFVFHTLRHTFASWLAIQGTPLFTIKELLGHKSIAMTERYAHLIPGHKQDAVNGLSAAFNQNLPKPATEEKSKDLARSR